MLVTVQAFIKNVKGATAIEYALIASLIAVVAISGMKLIGGKITEKFNTVASALI
jgi:pilus assembly protein Flp/PilA